MSDHAANARDYVALLQEHLGGQHEDALRLAYEAGRRALAEGTGVLEIVNMYRTALSVIARAQSGEHGQAKISEEALSYLEESLSPFEMVLRGVQDSNARLQQNLVILHSVEEQLRRQNEQLTAANRAIDQERNRYQALFDFAPDAYLVTGLEGAILEANTAAAELLRTPKELLPGQSLSQFVLAADAPSFRQRLRELHFGLERVEGWQVSLRPTTGPVVPTSITVVAECAAPPIANLRWVIRDITEQRRLEKERARLLVSQAQARASRRFEFLAQASALLAESMDIEVSLVAVARLICTFLADWCFVSIVEPDGSFRQLEVAHTDPTQAELAGALRRHCLFGGLAAGRSAVGLDTLQPVLTNDWLKKAADGPEHLSLLRSLFGSNAMLFPLQFRERRLGMLTLIAAPGARYRPADRALGEELARRCALAMENARLYREMVAARDRAERANRSKDEFFAVLGHELRNPLTPVVGWTRILKDHPIIAHDPTLFEGVRAMERNTATLRRLVDDCLELSRVSEGIVRLERSLVDLNQIVTESLVAIRIEAAEQGINLEVDLYDGMLPVAGDPIRLEQVVINLLTNAVKFSDAGGLIVIRTRPAGGDMEIEISDTGIGIDPAFLDQAFHPFRQGMHSIRKSQSGLGLGLSIAKRIVEMHGGRIWADSPGLGFGCTFRIRLPGAAPVEYPRAGSPVSHAMLSPGVRVLLVDDSEDILFLMKTDLEHCGHTVVTAPNGILGLEAARAHPPDVIISDIKMPGADGHELIRHVRATESLRTIPAIALTGLGSATDIEQACAAGFDACLVKPTELEEIEALIRQLSRRKHQSAGGGASDNASNRRGYDEG